MAQNITQRSFGKKGGTRTGTPPVGAVSLNATNGEYLDYVLTVVQGPVGVFAFVCEHRVLLDVPQPGHSPQTAYPWTLNKANQDYVLDDPNDEYTVRMEFGPAAQYRLQVLHRASNDSVIATVVDATYASTSKGDYYEESFRVLTS